MILARVVLPEPDSPTMPSVSPGPTLTLTPSSALTNPPEPIAKPLLTGKYFFRPTASIIRERLWPTETAHGLRRPTLRHVTIADRDRGRRLLLADRQPLGTARREGASRRKPR